VTPGTRIRKSLILTAMVAASCVQSSGDRMETLGQAMICMCRDASGGCGQLLSECNMIACPVSEPMRRELREQLAQGRGDREILAAFSEKYGPRVRSAPGLDTWWNVLAWVTPFGALLGGATVAGLFIKRSIDRAPESKASLLTACYENEVEEELSRHRPEE
jgi:cytochrome c-type biogenesis protein CcmH